MKDLIFAASQVETSSTEVDISTQHQDAQIQPIQKDLTITFEREYCNMPEVIKKLSDAQPSEYEMKMARFSSLVVLSGLMTNVHGVYHRKKQYPNLFLIVLAAAASGKGTISLSRKLIAPINEEVITESNRLADRYRTQISLYKQALKRGEQVSPPAKPPFRAVIIPADITPSRLVQHLTNANGQCPTILIEEEIDTSTASKKSYGDFSQILRKAASGETISLSRKGENEYVECKEPKLALIMSGTFGQIKGLIQNAEDGLYSRSLFYTFDAGIKWQSVSPCPDCINLSDLYEESGQEFLAIYKFLQAHPTEVMLTKDQWKKLNDFGESQLHHLYNFHGEETSALAKRHSLMVFKLCMVLSCVRKYEIKASNPLIFCSDIDFDLAMTLVQVSLNSSLKIIKQLPKATSEDSLTQKREFIVEIPTEFTRKDYLELAERHRISPRTADRWIKAFCESGDITKIANGKFQKKSVAMLAMATD